MELNKFFIKFKKFILTTPGALLGVVAFLLIGMSHLFGPALIESRVFFIAPPPMLERFVFGYNEAVADIFWIRAVQDFDYCDSKIAQNQCKNESWLFRMLDTTTNLAPKFRIPYAAGALALTIIISDIDGATKIFDKGVKELPDDWAISYRAAYHYLYEVRDKKRAAELLIQAGKNGAPPWVFSLAGRLYSDSGHLDLAERLLQDMKDSNQDPGFIKRLQAKIDSMKKNSK